MRWEREVAEDARKILNTLATGKEMSRIETNGGKKLKKVKARATAVALYE